MKSKLLTILIVIALLFAGCAGMQETDAADPTPTQNVQRVITDATETQATTQATKQAQQLTITPTTCSPNAQTVATAECDKQHTKQPTHTRTTTATDSTEQTKTKTETQTKTKTGTQTQTQTPADDNTPTDTTDATDDTQTETSTDDHSSADSDSNSDESDTGDDNATDSQHNDGHSDHPSQNGDDNQQNGGQDDANHSDDSQQDDGTQSDDGHSDDGQNDQPPANDSNQSEDNADDGNQSADSPDVPQDGYAIRIIYDGDWSGAYGSGGSVETISGSGTTVIDIDGDPFVISANAQKQDDSSKTLTVQILLNGDVVQESSTSAAYGVAQATFSEQTGNDGEDQQTPYSVRISYDGDWSGTIGIDGEMRSVDGSGTETFKIDGDPMYIVANAQKRDTGSGTLTIQILKNGDVIEEKSTSDQFGAVQISASV